MVKHLYCTFASIAPWGEASNLLWGAPRFQRNEELTLSVLPHSLEVGLKVSEWGQFGGLWSTFLLEVGKGKLSVPQVLRACLCFLALFCLIIWSWNNLILKQNIWAESNWEDVCWWCSTEGMHGWGPGPAPLACLGRECFSSLCFFFTFLNLVWRVTVKAGSIRARLLEQDCRGNCLWVFFKFWFPPPWVENHWFPICCYMICEGKGVFKVPRREESFIQRGESWPTVEFLCSSGSLHCWHAHWNFCSTTNQSLCEGRVLIV